MSNNITGNGQSVAITDESRQLTLDCQCGSNTFNIIVVPLGIRPGAAITKVQCLGCNRVSVVSDKGIVDGKSSLYIDHQNRKHHRMIAEPGIFSFKK